MKVEQHQNLMDAFAEFKADKNINRPTMQKILEEVVCNLLKRKFNIEDDEAIEKSFNIIINADKGDFEIWHNREVVADEDFEDALSQISLSDARKIDADFEIGEDVTDKISINDFGRREVLSIRQNLISRTMDLEKNNIYNQYKEKIGDIVSGEVYQVWKKEVLIIDDAGNELYLPKSEQIPSDFFKKGETVRGVVARVEMKNGSPIVIVSRTSPYFLERLFEFDVPEIMDGLITIKKIVRIPGEKAKVAVESYDDRIDPVGACVGMKGSRIHGIVRELRNENIDVIPFTSNIQLFIQRALSPAKITSITVNEEKKTANVFMQQDQVSLAIGKGGSNIKLAIQLTGYNIEVYRDGAEQDGEEDVDLEEFNDEIDEWVIEEFQKIGCDTAKSVLRLSKEELLRRTDLEEETIDDVLRILREEFEN
ncbi:MAG: transcription termination factor NusA [Bacteroidales bacterium]|nr:transcription termination factor NusA [Bacteroidales bacterium]